MAGLDVSHTSFLLTANTIETISAPLLSRLTIVRVDGPEPDHFDAVLMGMRSDVAAHLQCRPEQLPGLEPELVARLREAFVRGASLRRVRAAFERAIATKARLALVQPSGSRLRTLN
jgi:ATP-dependent Lon protease